MKNYVILLAFLSYSIAFPPTYPPTCPPCSETARPPAYPITPTYPPIPPFTCPPCPTNVPPRTPTGRYPTTVSWGSTRPPTYAPTTTRPPTGPPTDVPTRPPTGPPTDAPTRPPTRPPTDVPTRPPTNGPTDAPTDDPTTSFPSTTCPDGWIDGGHLGCFFFNFHLTSLSWVEAQAECEKMGGFLAEIKSEEQHNFIESMAIIEESFSGVNSWWLGLIDMGHEGRWLWSHSVTDAEFTSWAPGHPNTAPGNQDDCVAISLAEHFHWTDIPCFQQSHTSPSPICHREVEMGTTTPPASSTTTFQGCPSGWSQYQNSCYEMFTSSKTWSSARDYCRSIGAELPSIHSAEENVFANNLAYGECVWIGGTDLRSEGSWEWLDGSVWNFTNWLGSQPDGGISQNALAMDPSRSGYWRDLSTPSDSCKFLCKMY